LHVIEQNRQLIYPDALQQGEFFCQRRPGLVVKPVEHLERTQADTKTNAFATAKAREIGQLRGHRRRVRLLPLPTQKNIRLRGIEIKSVTMGRQGANQLPPLLPGPHGAVKSFNDAECRCHGRFPLRWFPGPVQVPCNLQV
jgi:hypothetical protein